MRKVKFLVALVATTLLATSASGQMNVDELFVGSNNFGQTADTFLAASGCGVTAPTPTGAIGFPDMHLILIANGTDDNGAVRLSQSADETTILSPNSVSCNAGGIHTGNSYYRDFDLSGISGDLNITSIELGIEICLENVDGTGADTNGFVPIQICMYFDTAINSIVQDGVLGPSGFDETFCAEIAGDGTQDLTVATIPLTATVPAGTGNLVLEIFSPGSDTEPATDFCFNKDPGGCDFAVGDVNQDGAVDLLDVAPFVNLLTSGMFQCEADINEDSAVDLLDVAPFVDILTGG